MMEQADGPMSIRQLAEQSFNMREHNKFEQKRDKQHNTVLFKRSFDPVISHNRKKTPLHGIKRMTKDGMIGNGDDTPVLLTKEEDENPPQVQQEPDAASVPENNKQQQQPNSVVWIGVGAATVFIALLLALAFW